MAEPTPPLTLLTGASGYIGFALLLKLLQHNHSVRCTILSPAEATTLLSLPALRHLSPGPRLTFALVPSITSPSAYADAIKGVTYVLHLASPLPTPSPSPDADSAERDMIAPAVEGTLNMLRAAKTEARVRRVVVTSSVVANLPWPPGGAVLGPESRLAVERKGLPAGSQAVVRYDPGNAVSVYRAAKASALHAVDRFEAEERPGFGIARVFPGYVFGRDERAVTAEGVACGSNGIMFALLRGVEFQVKRVGSAAFIDDVTEVHLRALEHEVCRGWGVSVRVVHNEAWGIVERGWPQLVKEGVFKRGSQENWDEVWDSSETERLMGLKLRGLEEMVTSLVGQYADLLKAERAAEGSTQ